MKQRIKNFDTFINETKHCDIQHNLSYMFYTLMLNKNKFGGNKKLELFYKKYFKSKIHIGNTVNYPELFELFNPIMKKSVLVDTYEDDYDKYQVYLFNSDYFIKSLHKGTNTISFEMNDNFFKNF